MGLLAALLLVVGIVGSLFAEDARPYRVGYNNWIGFIAFFVADEAGYFKDAGLDVETKIFNAPGEGLVPLLAGDLDAHLTTLDAVILKSGEAPGKLAIVGLIDTSNGADALVGSKGVASIKDLKGKKVAVTVGECNEVLLVKALQSAGMSSEDVEIVNMDPDAAGAALKAGNVDAAVTWEPWITQLIGEDDANVLYSTKDVPNILLDVVAVPTGSGKTAETRAFLEALDKATQLVKADPKKAAEMVSAKVEVPADEIVDMLGKVTLYDSAESVAQMKGPIFAAGDALAAFFKESGSVENEVKVKELFDPSLLTQ